MVLRLREEAPDWKSAKCRAHRPGRREDAWFGERDGQPDDSLLTQAAQICNGDNDRKICPRRHDCLIFALVNTEASGVWGGMQPDDLKYVRNHIPREDWIWRRGIPAELKAEGYRLRARKSRAA